MHTTPSSPVLTLEAIERAAIPVEAFNHRGHLTVAYQALREAAAAGHADPVPAATDRIRGALKAFMKAHNVQVTQTSGYHESLTVAWMRILHAVMIEQGPGANAAEFLDANPFLLCRTLLRLYYSKDRIMSWDARERWIEPDLAPLPAPRRS